jgi:D-amino-acid dehydrogenase
MSKHVVIIGAGVIGLSAAVECLRRGHRVTILEREGANHGGCSFGNAGMIVPSHFVPLAAPGMVALGLKWMWNAKSPFYIKPRLNWDLVAWAYRFWRASTPERVARAAPVLRDLHLASREAYARMAESGADFGLAQKGLLMLCKTAATLEEEGKFAERARALAIPATVLDAKETAALDPGATFDIAGAVHFPRDCHLVPERYMASLDRRVSAAGGMIRRNATVSGWVRSGSTIAAVRTDSDEIAADEFVLCSGAWSGEVVRELGLRLPMQAGKGYSVTLPDPVEVPQICSILTEARVAVTPMGGALRVGGTMELAGIHSRIDPRRVQGIVEALPRYYPKFRADHFANVKPWQGLRPCSPDGLPYLGRTNAARNVIVATGHAMMGLSLAPATGEIVGRLADGEPVPTQLELLNPDRYA